jgi:hypothetical protein
MQMKKKLVSSLVPGAESGIKLLGTLMDFGKDIM